MWSSKLRFPSVHSPERSGNCAPFSFMMTFPSQVPGWPQALPKDPKANNANMAKNKIASSVDDGSLPPCSPQHEIVDAYNTRDWLDTTTAYYSILQLYSAMSMLRDVRTDTSHLRDSCALQNLKTKHQISSDYRDSCSVTSQVVPPCVHTESPCPCAVYRLNLAWNNPTGIQAPCFVFPCSYWILLCS